MADGRRVVTLARSPPAMRSATARSRRANPRPRGGVGTAIAPHAALRHGRPGVRRSAVSTHHPWHVPCRGAMGVPSACQKEAVASMGLCPIRARCPPATTTARSWRIGTGSAVPSPLSALPLDKFELNAATALATDDVWIARGHQTARWDGQRWQRYDLPRRRIAIMALAALSPRDVWGVGSLACCPPGDLLSTLGAARSSSTGMGRAGMRSPAPWPRRRPNTGSVG
jgi:hypothetical protein